MDTLVLAALTRAITGPHLITRSLEMRDHLVHHSGSRKPQACARGDTGRTYPGVMLQDRGRSRLAQSQARLGGICSGTTALHSFGISTLHPSGARGRDLVRRPRLSGPLLDGRPRRPSSPPLPRSSPARPAPTGWSRGLGRDRLLDTEEGARMVRGWKNAGQPSSPPFGSPSWSSICGS